MNEFWIVSYILSFFGSVSFGYLILRFGVPDIRTVPRQLKLGLSGILGMGLFIISYFASLIFTPITFMIFLPVTTLICVFILGARNQFFAPKEVKLAVPVVKVKPEAVAIPLKPSVPPEEEYEKPRVLERKVLEKVEKPKKERKRRGRERKAVEEIPEEKIKIKYFRRRESLPEIKKEPGLLKRRRDRYLRRRGKIVEEKIEEAREDMLKPISTKPKLLEKEEVEAPEIMYPELGEGVDLSDLESIESLEELSALGELEEEELGELDISLEDLAGLSLTEKVPKEKGMGCPKCGSLKGTIVYCPYCGRGFCSNCSVKIERKGDMIFYQCPHCMKEVIVKEAKKEEVEAVS